MTPTTGPVPRRQFPALDTMRAVGALAVVATHCAFNAGWYSRHAPVGPLLARMDVGVAIFFVLSGFLLSRPWFVNSMLHVPPPAPGRYFWNRALRIMPPYLVVAVVALALVPGNELLGPRGWVTALTMTDIYVSDDLPKGLAQTWSLATEVAFYIALPLIMSLAVGRRAGLRVSRVYLVLGALCIANVVWTGFLVRGLPTGNIHLREWLPSYLTWFSAGILIALIEVTSTRRSSRMHRTFVTLASNPGACWVMAAALLFVASTPVAGPNLLLPATGVEMLTKNILYAGVAFLVLVPGVFASADSAYIKLLSHPILRRLGHISYGIFLVHMPILFWAMSMTGYKLFEGHFVEIFTLTLLISVPASELLYRFVELPAIRLKRRSPVTATATSAPSAKMTK